MKLEKVKEQYKDEWVLVEVLERDQEENPIEVNVLEHSPRRESTYEAMQKTENEKEVCHLFNSTIPKEGYAAYLLMTKIKFNPD